MASPTRDELIGMLAVYYDVNPRMFEPMADLTLERAWREIQRHETYWTHA